MPQPEVGKKDVLFFPKGMRNSNKAHIQQQLNENITHTSEGSWEVLSIQGQQIHRGRTEYLVEWKGYDTMSWVDQDELDTEELLEEWEINSEVHVLNDDEGN